MYSKHFVLEGYAFIENVDTLLNFLTQYISYTWIKQNVGEQRRKG